MTLNDNEVEEFRNFMINCCDIWEDDELKEEYCDTIVGLFYRKLNTL